MKNDNRIEELKKEIEKKRKSIGKKLTFNPITSCVFEFRGKNINLNILTLEKLSLLTVELSLVKNESKKLNIDVELTGNKIDDIFKDAKSKLDILSQKTKLNELAIVEKKLNKLLSGEKQTSLAIDELESLI